MTFLELLNSPRLRLISLGPILVLASFFVHELGHALVALSLGCEVVGFSFQLLVFSVWIENYSYEIVPYIMVAGGVAQGLFFLFIAPRVLSLYDSECKVLAVSFVIYGLLEMGGIF